MRLRWVAFFNAVSLPCGSWGCRVWNLSTFSRPEGVRRCPCWQRGVRSRKPVSTHVVYFSGVLGMNCCTRLSVVRLRGVSIVLWGGSWIVAGCERCVLGGFGAVLGGGGIGVSWCFDSRIVGVVSLILVVYVCAITLFGVSSCTSMA